jgi:hypothetical protein
MQSCLAPSETFPATNLHFLVLSNQGRELFDQPVENLLRLPMRLTGTTVKIVVRQDGALRLAA